MLDWLIGNKSNNKSVSELLRKKYSGLSNEIIYWDFINDHIVETTANSLLAVFEFRGYDNESSTEVELFKISHLLNDALREFGEGWSTHVDVIRNQALGYIDQNLNHFNDPTCLLVDTERMNLYVSEDTHYSNRSFITFSWIMPDEIITKINNLMFEREETDKSNNYTFKGLLQNFVNTIERVLSTIDNIFPYFEPLEKNTCASFLHYCITGDWQEIYIPKENPLLPSILADRDLIVDNYPRIGKKYIKTVSVYGMPHEVSPGMMSVINTANVEFRFNTRFIYVDHEKAQTEIKRTIEKWGLKKKTVLQNILAGFSIQTNKTNEYAEQQQVEANISLNILRAGETTYGYYTNTFVLMDEDLKKLENCAQVIYGMLKGLGFTAQIEDINTMDAYKGTWPGYTFENVLQFPIFSHQLSHLLPLTGTWIGSDYNPNPLIKTFEGRTPPLAMGRTTGSTPFYINVHKKDNGNCLIVGGARTGKSTLMKFFALQFNRYRKSKVFIFDTNYSFLVPCYSLVNGLHVDLLAESSETPGKLAYKFQPLANIHKVKDFAWALNWLANIYEINNNNIRPTAQMMEDLNSALKSIRDDPNPRNRSLSALATQVNDTELRKLFKKYVDNPAYSILNGEEDTLSLSDFVVFELSKLQAIKDPCITVPLLEYLFFKIENEFTGAPVLLVLDNLWSLIDKKMGGFAQKIKEWYKTLNSKCVAIVSSTSNLSDIMNDPIGYDIVQECKTKILLPNTLASQEGTSEAYEQIGLNFSQIQKISFMIEQRQYYMISENDRRLFELGLESTPYSYSILCRSSEEDIYLARKFKQEYKNKFTYYWLKHHQHEHGAYYWDQFYQKMMLS